jgi:type I restriction enzyme M protein
MTFWPAPATFIDRFAASYELDGDLATGTATAEPASSRCGMSVVCTRVPKVITGELKQQVDRVWDAFWSGGISNPLEVIEQITYLIFIRRLDDLQIAKENKANRTHQQVENPIYAHDAQQLRWSQFKNIHPDNMLVVVRDGVFPWLRNLGGEGSTYAQHMQDARFTIPTANLLTKVVDLIDEIPLGQQDTKGDIYEYMLGKIATAGQNGQFRTPRHIIRLMVEMTAPGPKDEICDPACGTAGFLMEAARFVSIHHADALLDLTQRQHFNHSMFHGFDFDRTMLRIASMNMLLHEVEQPDIRYRDSLAENPEDDAERYTLVLANPPFAGSLDYETTAEDLQRIVRTKKTELLFIALFLRLLKPGGRAAVIVPEGVLFSSSRAHKDIRKLLVDGHQLEAVIKLPIGVFKPYASASTAILMFRKTNSGGTNEVWFYDVTADGFSLDDRRTPLLPEDKLWSSPLVTINEYDHAKNNLPDVLARWARRNGSERDRTRTEQSFCVSKEEIQAAGYDLSVGRYKEVIHQNVEHRPPAEILDELERIEGEIQQGMSDLKGLLS